MISKSLVKKIGMYFIGNLSSKILSAILLPIYAFNVTADDLGHFDFSHTIMGILSPIIFLAIWEAILKFLLTEDEFIKRMKILTTSVIFSAFMAFFFSVFSMVGVSLFSEHSIKYPLLIVAMIIIHSFGVIWQYYTRALGKNKLFVISGVMSTIINFILVIVLVVFMKMGLLGLLVSYCVGQLSIIMISEIQLGVSRNINFRYFDFKLLKEMIKFSSPLVLNLISSWLIAGFGKIIIVIKLGSEANGLYSFSSRFSLIITMIGSVVAMALIEEAILSVKKNGLDKSFNSSLEGLFKIFQSITLVAVPAIVLFYSFLSETEFYDSLIYAPWLLLYATASTMATNIGSAFQAIGKTKYQFITTALGAIVTIMISVLFIEKFGIMAVIVSSILGATTMMISRYILINKFTIVKVNWQPIIYRTLLFIIITILCLNTPYLVSILVELLILIILLYQSKDFIKKAMNKFKGKGRTV